MPKEAFKEYCMTKNMGTIRGWTEEGPTKEILTQWGITETQFYEICEEVLMIKYKS